MLSNENISANHLDIGVGTGYFLDKCEFPSTTPKLTLLDLNLNSLESCAKRVYRYKPAIHVGNVLKPLDISETYDSVGLSYLLHCLPGTMRDKAIVFQNIKTVLNPNGGVFGTTILGKGVSRNPMAQVLMGIYNSFGIFSNTHDKLSDLEFILKENFRTCSTHMVGCVAFFTGHL